MTRRREVRSLTVLAVLLSVTFVPVFAHLIAANVALGWEKTTLTLSVVAVSVASLATIFGYRGVKIHSSLGEERERAAIQLIETMDSIEQSAFTVLGGRSKNTAHELRQVSLRQIRGTMLDLGIWTKEDTIGFDIALRARNAIFHGDLKSVDMVDLKYAIEKTKQLLSKIRSSTD